MISQREGMAIVAIGWTAVGLFGALTFYFASGFESFVDAVFESVSGFTTTGASILTNIEAVSKGLLFWRSHARLTGRFRLWRSQRTFIGGFVLGAL